MHYSEKFKVPSIEEDIPNINSTIKEKIKLSRNSLNLFDDITYGIKQEHLSKKDKKLKPFKNLKLGYLRKINDQLFSSKTNTYKQLDKYNLKSISNNKNQNQMYNTVIDIISPIKSRNTKRENYFSHSKGLSSFFITNTEETQTSITRKLHKFSFISTKENSFGKTSHRINGKHKKLNSLKFRDNNNKMVYKDTESIIMRINGACQNLQCALERKNLFFYKPKHLAIKEKKAKKEELDDEFKNEIVNSLKENSNEKMRMTNIKMINELKYASKLNSEFAFNANKCINDLFNKDELIQKNQVNQNKEKIKKLTERRTILLKKAHKLLKESAIIYHNCCRTHHNVE